MKRSIRKTACMVLASVVFFSAAGCSAAQETEKTENTTEETTTTEVNAEEEILEVLDDYCDAISDADGEDIVELSTDDLEEADTLSEFLDFGNAMNFDPDMVTILEAITDTITYEINEDSLVISGDGESAQVEVVFTEFDFLAQTGNDYEEMDDIYEYIENGETTDITVSISLELTEDGWRVSNTEEVMDDVYFYLLMAFLTPDYGTETDPDSGDEPLVTVEGDAPILTYIDSDWYEEVAVYPDVDYDPSYISRLTYSEYEIEFGGFSGFNISDWDFDAHTGTVDYDTCDSFYIALLYSCDIDDPDLSGFTFTIDHDGDVTVEDAEDMELTVDSLSPGSYTITLTDPWNRTIWEGYIEVV